MVSSAGSSAVGDGDRPSDHWNGVYTTEDVETVSWHQEIPTTSLRLTGAPGNTLIDIGAGASPLADHLLAAGWDHVTLLDVSAEGLGITRRRLVHEPGRTSFVVTDVLAWEPPHTYDVWHDRAVLHFLTDPADRARYAELASRAVVAGGRLVIGCFSADGPSQCSGLPTARRSAEQLAMEFQADFQLEHDETETHLTPAGDEQPLVWVVLRRRP